MKEHLEHSALHPKLAQVQSHLITERLTVRREFEDAYGTPGQAQLNAYSDVVRSVRPDLEEELIFRFLPGPRPSQEFRSERSSAQFRLAAHPRY